MNFAPSRLEDVGEATLSADNHPPTLPFVFSVGVTGHRIDTLPPEGTAKITERLREALKLLTASALLVHTSESELFTPDPARLDFISALADGADQIAADAALDLGYHLHAVLPFSREEYRGDLLGEEAQERFDTQLSHVNNLLELPGERGNPFDPYVMTGRAIVAHCDVLIAVWDGLKARGRGGTADVVELAIERGTPVVHVPTDPERPCRLMWAAFDPVVDTQGDDPMAERTMESEPVMQMLRALLLPPTDRQEREFLSRFRSEQGRRFRIRLEYPLLLAIARVKKLSLQRFVEKNLTDEVAEEWRQYRSECLDRNEIDTPIDLLHEAYSWADRLATRFAQTYRSGHIFNFAFGGFAVCLGLSAFMAPQHQFWLSSFEFFITLGIILNTIFGRRGEWHRRWLDYRQLAERLRPMRSLKLLGIAAPDPPGTRTYPVPERWIDWYAMAAWRVLACPSARITQERAGELAICVAEHEISPQVLYHDRNSQQIERLDRWLDKIGSSLFFATLIVSVATLIGYAFGEAFVNTLGNWFTLVSAGFPALGTAIFGIRFQGDFGASAIRSQSTSRQLKAIDIELRKRPALLRSADLTEEAARVMLGDLDEWCLLNKQHDLEVG